MVYRVNVHTCYENGATKYKFHRYFNNQNDCLAYVHQFDVYMGNVKDKNIIVFSVGDYQ